MEKVPLKYGDVVIGDVIIHDDGSMTAENLTKYGSEIVNDILFKPYGFSKRSTGNIIDENNVKITKTVEVVLLNASTSGNGK